MDRRYRRFAVLGLAAAAVLGGCSSSTEAPVPAALIKVAGDGQTGAVNQALANQIVVQVNDAAGSPIGGVQVSFTVNAGGGSLSGATATTGSNGQAGVTWTLGTSVTGAQQVSALIATPTVPGVTFGATATAGSPATAAKAAGDAQSGTAGSAVAVQPTVSLTDQFGNPVAGVTVTFAVTGGGGSITGATPSTNAAGQASVASWVLGTTPGANTLSATAPGLAAVTFTATGNATVATSIVKLTGDVQVGATGAPVGTPPQVRVLDNLGSPKSGVSVTFAVAGGGGNVTGAVATTDANGLASVGSWTLGGASTQNLSATVTGTSITTTFSAFVNGAGFNIWLVNVGPTLSAPVQAAFDSAVARWERIITGDLFNVPNVAIAAGTCLNSPMAVGPVTVDDIMILVNVAFIDGPLNVLGQAGPCQFRSPGFLSVAGLMRFDDADMPFLITQGLLNGVILHEMGHVLGIGTLWGATTSGCLKNASSPPTTINDTNFDCAFTVTAFDSIGGTSYTGGNKVPVENCGPPTLALGLSCGAGTVNGHWREPTFANELMTGYVNTGANPLSVITVASLRDIGYTVDYSKADAYSRTFTAPHAAARLQSGAAASVHLGDDVLQTPGPLLDRNGRVVGVYRP